jgi:hypothetical protein
LNSLAKYPLESILADSQPQFHLPHCMGSE